MKIYFESQKQELKSIVEQKAKFQKVMLLFDNNVTNIEINSVYEEIRDICVFNKCDIFSLDENEIFNGYRLIIYLCCADNYLKCGFNKDEFVNVFILQDNDVLPFVLNNFNSYSNLDNHLILKPKQVDLRMLVSINMNLFYNYVSRLLFSEEVEFLLDFYDARPITQSNMFEFLEENKEVNFVDVEIIKKMNISYDDIFIVDLIIIDLLLLLINKIKSGNLMFVDVYKHSKTDLGCVEKFYKFYQNENFISTIILNYNHLYNYCLKTRNKILEILKFFKSNTENVDEIIKKVQEFSLNSDGVLGYAYFYDVFNF